MIANANTNTCPVCGWEDCTDCANGRAGGGAIGDIPHTMQAFINTKFTKRDYEATNVVACMAYVAPSPDWIPSERPQALKGLTHLWTVAGVQYYGYL